MAASFQVHYMEKKPFNANKLGYYLDGWADLVVDRGHQAEQIRQTVVQLLQERQMPQVTVVETHPSFNNETRKYNATTTYPGAATTIYLGQHGKDLYVSWRTFIKPIINDSVLGAITIVSLLAAVYILFQGRTPGVPPSREINLLAAFVFALFFALGLGIVSLAGRVMKGDNSAYFFIEPSLFDAEDITAMEFSVHKMLLRALDKEGIDTSQLRLKQSFKGGRKNEDI